MKIFSKTKLDHARQKLLVNEFFQLRFLAFCGLTAMISCGLFYAASCYFFAKYTNYAIEAGLKSSDPFFRVLSNMEDLLTWFFAIVSGGIIVFTTVTGLIFSNRVAGPLFRLKKHMEHVAQGETLSGLTFREGDYFYDLATAYNRQMEYLRSKLPAPSKLESTNKPNDPKKEAA